MYNYYKMLDEGFEFGTGEIIPDGYIEFVYDEAPQEVKDWYDNYMFESTKLAKGKELEINFTAALEDINSYCDLERMTWDKQEREARAWLDDNTVSTPMMDAILETETGTTKEELANHIIANADLCTSKMGKAVGRKKIIRGEIDSATTVEELENIDMTFDLGDGTVNF